MNLEWARQRLQQTLGKKPFDETQRNKEAHDTWLTKQENVC